MAGIIVVLGAIPFADQIVRVAAAEYGWPLKLAQSVSALENLGKHFDIAAVVFRLREWHMDPRQTIREIRVAAPRARPILVHRFTDPFSWPEMAVAGAYHAIRVPFALAEVRQSFGFVWAARGVTITRKAVA